MDDAVLAVTRVGIIGGGQIEHLDAALVSTRVLVRRWQRSRARCRV
jgi:hypothetical protein